jgi:hypothetical protein
VTGPQITDEDVRAAIEALGDYNIASDPAQVRVMATQLRFAVESTLRPGGLVARAIADELERLADVLNDATDQSISQFELRAAAARWREGNR